MSRPTIRVIAPLLAAQLAIALVGCGTTPVTAQLDTRAAAPAAPTGAVQAPLTPTLTSQAAPTVTDHQAVVGAPAAAPAPARTTAYRGLFDHDFDKNDLARANPAAEDPETADAIKREYSAQGVGLDPSSLGGWGLIGAGAAAALLGIPAVGYGIYTGMIGSHDLLFPTDKTTFVKDPGQYGYTYEPDWFYTDNHLKLVAWYVPAEVPTRKGILVLHGHTSNKDTALRKYGTILHHDYNLYFYDSRFHGGSEGTMTTLGYYERNDALLALQRLRDRGNDQVSVMGESMGGAVAIEAAAMDQNVKSCWADCAFDSLHDAIAPRAIKRKYPFPNFVAFSVVETASIRAHGRLATADPIRWVDKIAPRPLYLVHGQADDDTTPVNSDKLYDKAGEPKTIWRTPNAHHAESVDMYPDEYKTRMLAFFHDTL